MKKVSISTAIAYPNARPHLGHALEFIQADCLARYYRMSGFEVLLTTGTDEHGTKIYKTAVEEGLSPQALVDRNSVYFTEMCSILNISYDVFFRTTDEMLKNGAQKLWKKLVEAGDIYKASYEGLYCFGCENYMLEKDLVDGLCPNHLRAPEKLTEENYFFRLSKYSQTIKENIESGVFGVKGDFRKKEILNILEDLADVSFSRPKSALPWGVEVPGDSDHVMYVWCDALANYLTGLDYFNEGENYKKFWPTTINMIGKDIMKFHAILWPAMVMSAGLPIPKSLYIHGFVTSEGKKMGKSLGNSVDPVEYAQNYGADSLRFYLLSQIPTQDDGDFSKARFVEVANSHLLNTVGNLVSRVVSMCNKYFGNELLRDGTVESGNLDEYFAKYKTAVEDYDLKLACEIVLDLAVSANKFVDTQKPWEIAKQGDMKKLNEVLFALIEMINSVGVMLLPIIPDSATKILDLIGVDSKNCKFEDLSVKKNRFDIGNSAHIFSRIEA